MGDFVNHHVHSHFSVLDGLGKPNDIVDTVVRMGQKSISLTDHGSMSGIPQMARAAYDAGIGFTPGCEAYFTGDRTARHVDRLGEKYYHMILLAHTDAGYHNLVKMQTTAWEEGFYHKPRIDYSTLEAHREGLTVTTACLGSVFNQHLLRGNIAEAEAELHTLIDIMGRENVFVELQRHGIGEQEKILAHQVELARKAGVELLATTDAHYCCPGDADAHDSLLCTSTKATKVQSNRFKFDSDQFFLHSADQMNALFPTEDFPRAVSNTVELAERTEFTLKMGKEAEPLMPSVRVDPGCDEDETFRRHVYAGAADPSRYGDENGEIPEHVRERIEYEIGVITEMGFAGYFIMVEHIISMLAERGITAGPGRGCLAGETEVFNGGGWTPISELKAGDLVYSRKGPDTVLAHWAYDTDPDSEIVSLRTDDGSTLRLTEKHEVLIASEDGPTWRKAAQILPGDTILSDTGGRHLDGILSASKVVTGVDTEPAPEKVYDIAVAGDPSFLTRSGTVHNSAPGSIVVYCLGITGMDPLAHDLYFERFLNPDRVSMPDIDIDIPKGRRQEALALIEQEYGVGHVAHLSNYNMMGMRDALRRAGKVFGLVPSQSDALCNAVAGYCEAYGESLQDFSQRGDLPKQVASDVPTTEHLWTIISTAATWEGTMFASGVHACGIVITDNPLDDHFPIRHSKSTTIPICQFDGPDTESLGGVKMDLLGLINLDQCEEAERNALLDLGVEVDSSRLPLDDPEVFEMLSAGRGGGVFQLGCLAGDTMVSGYRLDDLYSMRHSASMPGYLDSMFLGYGLVGRNMVKTVVSSGVKETVRMVTESGHRLTGTPDHRVFTARGWKRIGELSPGSDRVMVTDGDGTAIRGREDVLAAYSSVRPDLVPVPEGLSVTAGQSTFFPTFRHADDPEHLVLLYPESGHGPATRAADEVSRVDTSVRLTILSYSEAVEEVYRLGGGEGLPLPEQTSLSLVIAVTPAGRQETYDVMMYAPTHNFMASGVVTHNSSGIRSLSRRMKPEAFADLSALIALYRPGPMGSDTHIAYCDRKNLDAEQTVDHPDMVDILSSTYSLPVYQEDLMSLSRHFAGYTGAEADDLRKAVAKKIPAMMEAQRNKFIPAVNARFGGNLGQTLWDFIAPFGEYAFCRAHSSAYAATTYRTAWLKAHYPAQFAGAVIDHNLDSRDDLVVTIGWVRAEGIDIQPPDVQTSLMRSVTGPDTVTLPLHIVTGLGEAKAEEILAERESGGPFKSVTDFAARCKISKSLLINLAKAGALDSLGVSRARVVLSADDVASLSKSRSGRLEIENGLFGDFLDLPDDDEGLDLSVEPDAVQEDDKMVPVDTELYSRWERQALGVSIGEHPFARIRELESARRYLDTHRPVDEFDKPCDGVKFSGIILGVVKKVSKRGNEFSTFSLETDSAVVPGIVFSHLPDGLDGALVLAEGKIEDDSDGGDAEDFSPKAVCFGMKRLDTDALKKKG